MGIHQDVDGTRGSIGMTGVAVDPEDERRRVRVLCSAVRECAQAIRVDLGTLQVHGAAGAEPRHYVPCGQHARASLTELPEQPLVRAVPLALRCEAALVPGKGA